MKNTKNKTHTNKMNKRRIENERKKMAKDTLHLVIPSIYLILVEDHNFRDEELMDFNQKLYHSITLHQELPERAAVNTNDIIEILLNKYNIRPEVIYNLLGGSKWKEEVNLDHIKLG